MDFSPNLWAVLAATIANMALGSLWYSLLFGARWKAEMGFTPEVMQSMKMTATRAYVLATLVGFISAYVFAHFAEYAGAKNVLDGLQFGFWAWLGFAMPIVLGSVLWENRTWSLFVINVSYYLASFLAMGSIFAVWR